VGTNPVDIAVTPDGTNVYVTNAGGNSVSVISTATNSIAATIRVGLSPVNVGTALGSTLANDSKRVSMSNPVVGMQEVNLATAYAFGAGIWMTGTMCGWKQIGGTVRPIDLV